MATATNTTLSLKLNTEFLPKPSFFYVLIKKLKSKFLLTIIVKNKCGFNLGLTSSYELIIDCYNKYNLMVSKL